MLVCGVDHFNKDLRRRSCWDVTKLGITTGHDPFFIYFKI